MTISAKIIADSISPAGKRITTMQLRYPRFVHAEFMTHRVFSRNASSSRAIPVERLIEDIIRDTAMPIHWGKNQPGMQAREEHDDRVNIYGDDIVDPKHNHSKEQAWNIARDQAIRFARAYNEAGYHKQIVNRLLEPFSHINVVVTSTEWSNFFALRRHEDAQPEIRVLAEHMYGALSGSKPVELRIGDWHVPYITPEDRSHAGFFNKSLVKDDYWAMLIKVSVARCARVSYLTHEGKTPDFAADTALYDRLLASVPLHASPAEHQATPDERGAFGAEDYWCDEELHGNFVGWIQFRKTLEGENQ